MGLWSLWITMIRLREKDWTHRCLELHFYLNNLTPAVHTYYLSVAFREAELPLSTLFRGDCSSRLSFFRCKHGIVWAFARNSCILSPSLCTALIMYSHKRSNLCGAATPFLSYTQRASYSILTPVHMTRLICQARKSSKHYSCIMLICHFCNRLWW